MRRILKFIFSLFLLLHAVYAAAQGVVSPKHEYRAVWLTTIENLDWPRTKISSPSDVDTQKRELVAILDSLQRLNVNTVLLQTRLRGDVIYPSAYEPFSAVLTGTVGKDPGYDPLAFAVEECHKRNMQLHAWLVTLPLGKVAHVNRLGRRSLRYKKPRLCTHYQGQWYMEPSEPGTADYLCALVGEIVSKYDIDGIHLDYIRYPDRPKGYPDAQYYKRDGSGLSLADWRRSNISRIVAGIYRQVKSLKPWVRVSCAPLGKHDDLATYSSRGWNAYATVYQEAQEWLCQGIMDILFPMLYFPGNDFYPFVRDWQENASGRHIVPGVGVYRLLPSEGDWSPAEVERQLYTSRAAGTAGSAMFRTRHLLDNIKGAADIYSRIYDAPALVPPMEWAVSAPPTAPDALVGVRSGDSVTLRWNVVPVDSCLPRAKYNVYVSDEYPVNVNDASNLVSALLGDTVCRLSRSGIRRLYWAVTAVDAFGVEGAPACWTDNGAVPYLLRDEFILPAPRSWGMRIVLRELSGVKLYDGYYRRTVGVRGLPPGCYILEIQSREGAVLRRFSFTR